MNFIAWMIFVGAAALEVSGDALIRKGLRGQGNLLILLGFFVLGFYGLVVNLVRWDFSKMLGVYVAFFAMSSVLVGRYFFSEVIPPSTWIGLMLIVAGGLVIQSGVR
jgi:multidrug transporter EmrE-like cation transporter